MHYILGGLGAGSRWQTSVDKLLRTIAGFGRRTQEGLANSRQEAVDSSAMRLSIAEIRRLRERLNDLDAHRHHLHI